MSEYDKFVVETKNSKPVFHWSRGRYRVDTSEQFKQSFLKSLRINFLVFSILLLLGLIVPLVALTALGETIADGVFHSVSIKQGDTVRNTLTDASTVDDLLTDLGIELHPLDIVRPAGNIVIDTDGLQIEISRGQHVRIIDGTKQALQITNAEDPLEIVRGLGYAVDTHDVVRWHETQADNSLAAVPTIEIERANDYHLNINGRISANKARATSVGDILSELGHTTGGIAYIRPLLHQMVIEGNSIVVYYEKPNQEIIIETETAYEGGMVHEREVIYQVIHDSNTGEVVERNTIEEYLISSSPIDTAVAENVRATGNKIISNSHRVGDLTEEQMVWLRAADIDESDWFYVDYIIFRESRWSHSVWNTHGSSAYGLCQALPASKMSSFGADYMTNPITQLQWCDWYAHERYGGWQSSYQAWLLQHWW